MDTIEKYLYGRFCWHIRSARGLPRVGPPYSIETRDFGVSQRFALIATLAISSADKVTATAELRKLALYLTATIDQIEASAVDLDGKPLIEPR